MCTATQFSIASIITVCRIRFSSVRITIDLIAAPSCPVVARCYACTTRVIPSIWVRPGKWPRPISRMPLKKTMVMTMPVHFAAARRVDGKCASSGVYAAAQPARNACWPQGKAVFASPDHFAKLIICSRSTGTVPCVFPSTLTPNSRFRQMR